MERGKTLADALRLVEFRHGKAYSVNTNPLVEDLAAIEVVTNARTITYDLEKDYDLIDAWTANSTTMVLLSKRAKRVILIDCAGPNVLGTCFAFKRPVVTRRKGGSR